MSSVLSRWLVKPQPYRHNDGCEKGPAQLPPDAGSGAHHLLDVVVESVDTCDVGVRTEGRGELPGPWSRTPLDHLIQVWP